MKKLILGSVTLLSLVTLAACSSNNDKANKTSDTHASKQVSKESSTTSSKVDNSQYDSIINEIKTSLDPENTGEVTIEVENNVMDAEYPDGHDIIRVLLTGESKNSAQEALEAVNSNTATTDQSNVITLLRMSISEYAKKLPNDTATIDFGYKKSANQYDLIAKSSKVNDIIPVGQLVTE